jgi:hypothetical protein
MIKPLWRLAAVGGLGLVDGVKIDVVGEEMLVLGGAAYYLQNRWPRFMMVECLDQHLRRFGNSSQELVKLLRGWGYQVRFLDRGRWMVIDGSKPLSGDLLALRRT